MFDTVFPAAADAPPAKQRARSSRPTVFARPGIPTLESARDAAAAAPGDRLTVARVFAGCVLSQFPREGAGCTSFEDRLFADLVSVVQVTPDPVLAIILWAASRMTTALARSVQRYMKALEARFQLMYGWSPLKNVAVALFLKRAMMMEGVLRMSARPALAIAEYYAIIRDERIPQRLRCVCVLAWRRMARVADILELRFGDVWSDADKVWVLQSFHKTAALGAYDRLAIALDSFERDLLGASLCASAPTTPSMQRPLLFDGVRTSQIAAAVETHMSARLGAHSFRRGAMRAALDAGVTMPQAMLLSLHRSEVTALGYVLYPDIPTAAVMTKVSWATTAPPVPDAPDRARGTY